MFNLLRNGWETVTIYGIDAENNKFLIYEYGNWEWVPMYEFEPIIV